MIRNNTGSGFPLESNKTRRKGRSIRRARATAHLRLFPEPPAGKDRDISEINGG
jgi:hypothetical protein